MLLFFSLRDSKWLESLTLACSNVLQLFPSLFFLTSFAPRNPKMAKYLLDALLPQFVRAISAAKTMGSHVSHSGGA